MISEDSVTHLIHDEPEIPVAIAAGTVVVYTSYRKKKDLVEALNDGYSIGSLVYRSVRLLRELCELIEKSEYCHADSEESKIIS